MVSKWTTLEDSWKVLDSLADPYVGIVRREYRKLRDVDDVWGHSYGAHGTDSKILFGVPSNSYNGGGSDNAAAARLAAIGETVERYSAAYLPFDSDVVCFGSQKELEKENKRFIGYKDWELYAPTQFKDPIFPHEVWDENTKLWWRKGTYAKTNEEVWTLGQLIHIANHTEWPGDTNIGHATSNGLACGITFVEAAISGLFETVERDAFMLTWYNKLSLPQIDVNSSPRLKRFYERYIKPTSLRLHLVDMTVFSGIPSVLAVVRNPHTNLAPFAIGAASSYSIEKACEKAAIEGMYTRTWVKTEQRLGNALVNADFNRDINSFEDHIKLYAGTDIVKEADFLTSNSTLVDVNQFESFDDSSPDALWNNLNNHLYEKGFKVATFDLTSPDIKDAGAHVVKSIIPGFKPIDVLYRGRMLGGERILRHSYDLGLVPEPFTIETLNPVPHPFP
ncbi:YcaO-like family protein [Bacillus velezensis]|uniref:YcaO-like family protein n=2 Tax=Bacteria TaxID=2 RepID=UPI003452B75F